MPGRFGDQCAGDELHGAIAHCMLRAAGVATASWVDAL